MDKANEKEYEIGECKVTLNGCHITVEEIDGKKFIFLSVLNNGKSDGGFILKISEGQYTSDE